MPNDDIQYIWEIDTPENLLSMTADIIIKLKNLCRHFRNIWKDCILYRVLWHLLIHFTANQALTESIWTGWSLETKCWQVSRHDMIFLNSNNLNFTIQIHDTCISYSSKTFFTFFTKIYKLASVDLRVTWVCIHDLTWHQNDLKVDQITTSWHNLKFSWLTPNIYCRPIWCLWHTSTSVPGHFVLCS